MKLDRQGSILDEKGNHTRRGSCVADENVDVQTVNASAPRIENYVGCGNVSNFVRSEQYIQVESDYFDRDEVWIVDIEENLELKHNIRGRTKTVAHIAHQQMIKPNAWSARVEKAYKQADHNQADQTIQQHAKTKLLLFRVALAFLLPVCCCCGLLLVIILFLFDP